MRSFPRILAATAAALALTSSLALAAEPAAKAPAKAPAPVAAPMHGGGHGMALASLTPEKQEIARTLMAAHSQAMAPLHQSAYAKGMELEALNAAGEGESSKAKSVIREIADLNAKMLTENAKFRAQMVKKTGLRTPVMGHGMMMGGMSGGMMGKGMMGKDGMSCGMMGSKDGVGAHAGHGAGAVPVPAAPSAPAADPHAAHAN